MRIFALFACLSCAVAQNAPITISQLLASANASYMHGDYEKSLLSLNQAWQLAGRTPADDPVRYDILKQLVSVHGAAGEFADAGQYLQLAINWRENVLGMDDPGIADDMLEDAALCRSLKDYTRARAVLQRVMVAHRKAYGPESAQLAGDYSRMAQIDLDQKDLEAASVTLEQARAMRTRVAGQLDASLLPDLDRLGTVYIALRSYDKAEGVYRHALVIRETLYGSQSADLIPSLDGIAYSCFGQGKYAEAEPVYQRLIALWETTAGDHHPMLAFALDKVAVFYATQKKYEQAKAASERANAIRARFLGSGLADEAAEQYVEGNKDVTIALYRRALKVLEPPNPLYDAVRAEIDENLKAIEGPPRPELRKTLPKK